MGKSVWKSSKIERIPMHSQDIRKNKNQNPSQQKQAYTRIEKKKSAQRYNLLHALKQCMQLQFQNAVLKLESTHQIC